MMGDLPVTEPLPGAGDAPPAADPALAARYPTMIPPQPPAAVPQPAAPAPTQPPQRAASAPDVPPTPDAAPVPPEALAPYQELAVDGLDVDPVLMARANETFVRLGVAPEDAQKLLELHVDTLRQQDEAITAERASWRGLAEALPEMRAPGAREALSEVTRLLDTPAREFLNGSGLGDHPDLIRIFARLGQELKRRGTNTGVPVAGDPAAAMRARYPSMFRS